MIKGIDVSKYQNEINFKKVKEDGVEFVIIRAGLGKNTPDYNFTKNIKAAIKEGLKIGVYWFVYAKNKEDLIGNIKMADATLRNYKKYLDLGVYVDYEYDSDRYAGRDIGKAERTDFIKTFVEEFIKRGYKAGVYLNPDYIKTKVNYNSLKEYPLWLAYYTDEKNIKEYNPVIWQYTSKGKINGIKGDVDLDYGFFENEVKEPVKPTDETKKGIVATNGKNLMLRKDPNTKAAIVAKIPNGKEIILISKTGDWFKASYNNKTGYVFAKYVKEL